MIIPMTVCSTQCSWEKAPTRCLRGGRSQLRSSISVITELDQFETHSKDYVAYRPAHWGVTRSKTLEGEIYLKDEETEYLANGKGDLCTQLQTRLFPEMEF